MASDELWVAQKVDKKVQSIVNVEDNNERFARLLIFKYYYI